MKKTILRDGTREHLKNNNIDEITRAIPENESKILIDSLILVFLILGTNNTSLSNLRIDTFVNDEVL